MSTWIKYIKKIPGVSQFASFLDFDKAIFYTIIGVIWSVIAGPLSIFFIINYLTITEQGYWYTFLSLGALATFAELGFTTIITQFISHEYAHIKENSGILCGSNEQLDRTVSLVQFSFKFYIIVTLLAFILLTVVGVVFLMYSSKETVLLLTWIFYSFTGAFLLLVSLFGAVLRGFDKVDLVQKIVFISSIVNNVVTWTALFLGFGLWALALGGLINIFLSLGLFYLSSTKLWKQLFLSKVTNKYNWLKDTLPLQWRYAISWTSGYFIFQFMVPVTMFYGGAVLAGKLGLSLVMARAVQSIANSWGMTKIPKFNMFVARENRESLDNLLKKIQWQSLMVFIGCAIALLLVLIFIFPLINWNDRVLPTYEIAIILIAEGVNLIIFNWAYYLRSHKEEPYMRISFINGLAVGITVWLSMFLYSSTLIALSFYCIVQFIMLIPAWSIFVKKRKEYGSR